MSPSNSDRLQGLVRRFRILRPWRITLSNLAWPGHVCINERSGTAAVGHWRPGEAEPEDYQLHEVLHCALRRLCTMDRRKPKELRIAEEELVQDICGIVVDAAKKGKVE